MREAPRAEAVEDEGGLEVGAAEVEESRAQPDEPQVQPIFTGAHGVGARFAGRIGRHATAYGIGGLATSLAGLLSIVVFTRFLDPTEFGKVAVLTTASMVTTLVASLTILPGTMRRVYGTSGDEEAGDVDAERLEEVVSGDPRLALSTGFAMVVVTGALVLIASWPLSGWLAGLFGEPGEANLVVFAVGAGVIGSLMRFGQYMLRLQLRSTAYVVVSLVCAFGSIALAIPLLAAGLGIEAVLIGLFVGNALAAAISIALLAGEFRLAVSLREAKAIMSGGLSYLPMLLSFQAVHLGDTLLVAGLGSFSETGVYRVAQRIALPVSFGTSVFQQAWGPLKRDMTHAAVDRVDESRAYTARLFTYYAVFVTALILTIAALAGPLVRLASGEFGEAVTLVPLTAVSVAGHGWFIFAYRNARLPRQMLWMGALSAFAAFAFIAFSFLLIPSLGAVGAPLAATVAWGIATSIMLVANQLIGKPIPFEYRSLLVLGALTTAAWLVAKWLLPDTPLGTAVKLGLLLAWASGLLATGIVPMAELRAFARLARDATGIDSRRRLRARIADLDGTDAVLVDGMVRRGRPSKEVAERAGLSEEEAMAGAVHALRRTAGGGDARETDAELGALLFAPMSRAERDIRLIRMVNDGGDPIDTDFVTRAAVAARSRRRRVGTILRRR